MILEQINGSAIGRAAKRADRYFSATKLRHLINSFAYYQAQQGMFVGHGDHAQRHTFEGGFDRRRAQCRIIQISSCERGQRRLGFDNDHFDVKTFDFEELSITRVKGSQVRDADVAGADANFFQLCRCRRRQGDYDYKNKSAKETTHANLFSVARRPQLCSIGSIPTLGLSNTKLSDQVPCTLSLPSLHFGVSSAGWL